MNVKTEEHKEGEDVDPSKISVRNFDRVKQFIFKFVCVISLNYYHYYTFVGLVSTENVVFVSSIMNAVRR